MSRRRFNDLAAIGMVLTLAAGSALAQESVTLAETIRPGMIFGVKTRVQIVEGTLRPPASADKGKAAPEPIQVTGDGAMEYEESVLGLGSDNLVNKTIRLVQRMEVKRTLGGQPQENVLRPAVRRLVVLRDKQAKAPFSPDGPLLWSEIDLVRTDVFTPLLLGLLPGKAVAVGDRWKATESATLELTGLERIEEGGLDCTLSAVQTRDGRKIARVGFQGTVRGSNEDGPNRHEITGHYEFDLGSATLTFLTLNGAQVLLAPDGQSRGRIVGRLALQRQPLKEVAGLSSAALRPLQLDPTDENTLLLFDNPDLGVKFLYPRRWRLASVKGQQIEMDTPDGHGLLVTLEPTARLPTGAAYLKESREWVEKQRGKINDVSAPRAVSQTPALENFSLDVEIAGQGRQLDYTIARHPGGGLLFAASLISGPDARTTRAEVRKIAESATLTRRLD